MKRLDVAFGCLLALGGVGHGLGAFEAYSQQPMSLLWVGFVLRCLACGVPSAPSHKRRR